MNRQLLPASIIFVASFALGLTACAPDAAKQYSEDLATNARPLLNGGAPPSAQISLTITARALYLSSKDPFSREVQDALEGTPAIHDANLIAIERLPEDTTPASLLEQRRAVFDALGEANVGLGASSDVDAAQLIEVAFALEGMGHRVTELVGGPEGASSALSVATSHCEGVEATPSEEERCDMCAKISGRDALEERTCAPLVIISSSQHVDLAIGAARARDECAAPLLTPRDFEDTRACTAHASFTDAYKNARDKNELCPELSFGAREGVSYGQLLEHMSSARSGDAERVFVLIQDTSAAPATCPE